MKPKILSVSCNDYQPNTDTSDSALRRVSSCIDSTICREFEGRDIVLRAVQSKKHNLPRDKFIEKITESGTDRFEMGSEHEVNSSDKEIDLFGKRCHANPSENISLSILEGFHKWKPMSLERPQLAADIWLVYDADQLTNVGYHHRRYDVRAKDAYLFNNPADKAAALIGLIVLN